MSERNLSVAAAVAFAVVAMVAGYRAIGLPGGDRGGLERDRAGDVASHYRRQAVDPDLILPPFLLTVAALETHMAEEYLTPRPAADPAGPPSAPLGRGGWRPDELPRVVEDDLHPAPVAYHPSPDSHPPANQAVEPGSPSRYRRERHGGEGLARIIGAEVEVDIPALGAVDRGDRAYDRHRFTQMSGGLAVGDHASAREDGLSG
jgi:hypothetical protein